MVKEEDVAGQIYCVVCKGCCCCRIGKWVGIKEIVIEQEWSGSDVRNLGGSTERKERVSWVEKSRIVCQ